MIVKLCVFGKGCEVNKFLESFSLKWWFSINPSVVTVVKNLSVMGLEQTLDGKLPRGLEVFQKMELKWSLTDKRSFIRCVKRKKLEKTLYQQEDGMAEVGWRETSLIDNGSKCFFQKLFLLFLGFFQEHFMNFFLDFSDFLIFLNFCGTINTI